MAKHIDLTGQKFGKLTVLERAEDYISPNGYTVVQWLCKCECGNTKVISGKSLRKKNGTKSCGCKTKEVVRARMRTHKKSKTKLYAIWIGIKERCYRHTNKSYKYYGDRGIVMDKNWEKDFMSFFDWAINNGYKEGLSIDRINNNGNYEPSNCRWANRMEQGNNKRNNIILIYKGKKYTLAELARIHGMRFETLYARIYRYEWSLDKALTQPLKKRS